VLVDPRSQYKSMIFAIVPQSPMNSCANTNTNTTAELALRHHISVSIGAIDAIKALPLAAIKELSVFTSPHCSAV
jgi:hypothetical protein